MTLVGYRGLGPDNLIKNFAQSDGRAPSVAEPSCGVLGYDSRDAIAAAVAGKRYGCRTMSPRKYPEVRSCLRGLKLILLRF